RRGGWVGEQSPQGCRASVAQDRALAAGEQGRHAASMLGRHRVADEVDAAVHLVEALVAEAKLDLGGRDAGSQELPPRDDSVLARRIVRNQRIDSSTERLGTHIAPNPTLDGSA